MIKKGTVIRSFSGRLGSHTVGEIVTIPDGCDWVAAGFVELIKPKRKPRKKAASK